jgi:hypothetical protein
MASRWGISKIVPHRSRPSTTVFGTCRWRSRVLIMQVCGESTIKNFDVGNEYSWFVAISQPLPLRALVQVRLSLHKGRLLGISGVSKLCRRDAKSIQDCGWNGLRSQWPPCCYGQPSLGTRGSAGFLDLTHPDIPARPNGSIPVKEWGINTIERSAYSTQLYVASHTSPHDGG